MSWGLLLALLGAGLSVTLTCIGSAKGVGMVAEASAPVIAEDSSKFSKLLILMLLPGSQGLYGLVVTILLLTQIGILGGSGELTLTAGILYFLACLPIAIGGYSSSMLQARVALTGVGIISKRPQDSAKAVTSAALVEFYALLSFITSLLIVVNISNLGV
ncbi:MAG: V-type ATP synthase subunit K [Clostridia bacterium]|nr:V-type ATP synthase subunit K [Clostridia bacterium]